MGKYILPCNAGLQVLFGAQPSTMRVAGHELVQDAHGWLIAVDAAGVRYLVSAGDSRDWVLYPVLANDRVDEEGAVRVAKVES